MNTKKTLLAISALFLCFCLEASDINKHTKKESTVIANKQLELPATIARNTTEKLIEHFNVHTEKYIKNKQIMYDEVGDLLNDIIAFDEVTTAVMGKYRVKATEEQIKKFKQVLKSGLIQFYSKVFLEFEAQDFKLQKVDEVPQYMLDEYKQGKRHLISVNLVITKRSETYNVKYSMIYSGNKWKVKNIIFKGMNIGIQLRNRFADIYLENESIAEAIDEKNWNNSSSGNLKKIIE